MRENPHSEPETPCTDEQMALLGWQDGIKKAILEAEI